MIVLAEKHDLDGIARQGEPRILVERYRIGQRGSGLYDRIQRIAVIQQAVSAAKLAGHRLGCAVYNERKRQRNRFSQIHFYGIQMIRRRQRLSVILYGIDVFSDREAHFGDIVPETDCVVNDVRFIHAHDVRRDFVTETIERVRVLYEDLRAAEQFLIINFQRALRV